MTRRECVSFLATFLSHLILLQPRIFFIEYFFLVIFFSYQRKCRSVQESAMIYFVHYIFQVIRKCLNCLRMKHLGGSVGTTLAK